MKRLLLLVFIVLFTNFTSVFSQGGPPPPPLPNQNAVIYFNYDNAGNQTRKYYKVVGIVAKKEEVAEEVAEEIADVDVTEEENLSQLAYYPNPIENELILNWSTSINSRIASIEVYSIDARLIHSYKPEDTGEYRIPFNSYTSGIYIVKALFDSGKKDTFKVLKK